MKNNTIKRILSVLLSVLLFIAPMTAISEETLWNIDLTASEALEELPAEAITEAVIVQSASDESEGNAAEDMPSEAGSEEALPAGDVSKETAPMPVFLRGYAKILEGGADVREAAASDSAILARLVSGTIYLLAVDAENPNAVQILYLPEQAAEPAVGWISFDRVWTCVPAEEIELCPGEGVPFVLGDETIPLWRVVCAEIAEAADAEITENTSAENTETDVPAATLEPELLKAPSLPGAPAVTGIELMCPTELGQGEYVQLWCRTLPEGAGSGLTYTYTSSQTRCISIDKRDNNDYIYGRALGTAVITAKASNGMQSAVSVTVKNAPSSIKIYTNESVLGVGDSTQLYYTLSEDSAGSINECIISDTSVLSVGSDGMIHALKPGTATIKLILYNSLPSAPISITVKKAPTRITPDFTEAVMEVGQSRMLGYTLPADEGGLIVYSSSAPETVSVDNSGNLTALAPGEAVVTLSHAANPACSATCTVTVNEPTPEIEFYGPSVLGAGDTAQFTANLLSEDLGKSFTFASENPSVASISNTGLVAARKVGITTLSASYGNAVIYRKLRVTAAPSSVTLSVPNTLLGVGESVQPEITFNGSAYGRIAEYLVGNPSVIEVNEDGGIVAKACGSSTLRVRTYNNKISNAVTITVKNPPTAIIPDYSQLSLMPGSTFTLGYSLPEGEYGRIIYTSSDSNVVSVDQNGLLTAITKGSAEITLSHVFNPSCRAVCTVNVSDLDASLEFNGPAIIGLNDSIQFETKLLPEGYISKITYASSNPEVASISASGVVTARSTGSATLCARTAEGVFKVKTVRVVAAPSSIRMNLSRTTLGVGETIKPSYTFPTDTFGRVTEISSSDKNVIQIGDDGVLIAKGVGTATVRAKAYNGKTSDSITITVKNAPSRIILTTEAVTLGVGETIPFTAKLNDGSAGEITMFTSNHSVASLSDDVLTAKGPGITVLTFRTYVPGATAQCEVTVMPAPDLVWMDSKGYNVGLGSTYQLVPRIPEGTATHFTYSSTDPEYVSVDENGLTHGIASGDTIITITTHNGKTFNVIVTCTQLPNSISFNPSTLQLAVGEKATPAIKFNPEASSSALKFYTMNPDIASVDLHTGEITALSPGEATIRAQTDNNKITDCKVKVVTPSAPLSVINLNVERLDLGVGQTFQLEGTIVPESQEPLNYSVLSGTAVSVTDDGLVTAKATGEAVVRVSTESGLTADCPCTVYPAPTSISFANSSYTVSVGESIQLNCVLKPSNARTNYTITIQKSGYFTVDETGLLTGVSRGTTTITFTTHNGKSATATVQVVDNSFPESASFAEQPPKLIYPGNTYTPKITVQPTAAKLDMQWSSSDPSVIQVDASTGTIRVLSYGGVTITGISSRNPSIVLAYNIIALAEDRCLSMPRIRLDVTGLSTSQVNNMAVQNQAAILEVYDSALCELGTLLAYDYITNDDFTWRMNAITRAFNMATFPWGTASTVEYWKAANDEGGRKKFYPNTLYFGLPYTQNNRNFDEKKVVSDGYFTKVTGTSFYKLNTSKFAERMYAGNDCSSFVSIALWGRTNSRASDTTSVIKSASYYTTVSNYQQMIPGDVIWKEGHVLMFLYFTNEAHTQFCCIEQGGDGGKINDSFSNTIACTIKQYDPTIYTVRRPKY